MSADSTKRAAFLYSNLTEIARLKAPTGVAPKEHCWSALVQRQAAVGL